MKTYIGVDLGGTNVRAAKVTADGLVLHQEKGPSFAQEGPKRVLKNLADLIHRIPDWQTCAGMGVGVPGPVDTVAGKMVLSTNLPGFAGYPFAAYLTQTFQMPSYIDNDANVAGLAEALVGAGKGKHVVFYVTLSTGIGGGVIIDGKTVSGRNGFAGEIANMIIDRNREKVNYLNVGAVENEASGTAVMRKAQAAMPQRNLTHAGEVFQLAADGDPAARQIVDGVTYDLAEMFSLIGAVLDPDIFIVGGGMTKSADKFFPQMIAQYQQMVHEPLRSTPFAVARLEEPGIIGAAMLPVSHGC